MGWQTCGLIPPLRCPNQRHRPLGPDLSYSPPPTRDFEGRDAPRSLSEHPKNSVQFPAGMGQTVRKKGEDIKGDFQTS